MIVDNQGYGGCFRWDGQKEAFEIIFEWRFKVVKGKQLCVELREVLGGRNRGVSKSNLREKEFVRFRSIE